MKYVVMQDPDGVEQAFVFPREVDHDVMAEALACMKNQTHGNWYRVLRIPVSAGFVDSEGTCFGHSESLGLKSRPTDTALLASHANR